MAAESTSALLAQIPLVAGAADVLPSDESTLQWVTSAVALVNTKGDVRALSTELRKLDTHLALRTVVSGSQPTLGDLAIYGALKGLAASTPTVIKLFNQVVNVGRWFAFIEAQPAVQAALGGADGTSSATSSSSGAGEKKPAKTASHSSAEVASASSRLGHAGNFDNIQLTDAVDGAVVTRFPPEPSGYLHIGHIKAALLNSTLADKYHGKMLLRFDDTNPSKEKVEYVESIKEDLKKIGIVPFKISYTSDYFDRLLELGTEIIKRGKAYVDATPHEEMKEGRMHGIESAYRNNSIEENLRLWNEMIIGSDEGKKCLLRAKIDMQCPNKCLRDPGLYRVVDDTPHHRTGVKYKAYPLYDFACPIVDSLEGVTHAMRSSEYHDRNPLYYWVLDALSLRKVYIEDFSRLNFTHMVLSKRKLQWFVDTHRVEGWNSPAFPTIQGLLRRGLTVQALREFILIQGASKADVNMETNKLWAVNRGLIDPVIPRYTAIDAVNVPVKLLNYDKPGPVYITVPRHRKNPDLGTKVVTHSDTVLLEPADAITLSVGEEVSLMNWGNIIVRAIHKSADGSRIESIDADLNPAGSFKTTSKKLTWLSAAEDLVPCDLVEYDYLITVPKLGPDDQLEQVVNDTISVSTPAVGSAELSLLQHGDRVQFERRGNFIVDRPHGLGRDRMQLILIPDGKTTRAMAIGGKVDKTKGSSKHA